MLSDNGSTFKSVSNVIKKIVSDPAVLKHLAGVSVEWYHNLEKAPWWGRLFERLIGMTKRCLRKAIGRVIDGRNRNRSYFELSTPPLCVSGDLEEPLTPIHLINGKRLTNLPDELCFHRIEEEFTTISLPVLLNKRMRHLQLTLDRFWKRWREEYLLSLRERYQYKNQRRADQRKISEGDIVIIHEDQTVRGFWRLGKIRELITGWMGRPEELLLIQSQEVSHECYGALCRNSTHLRSLRRRNLKLGILVRLKEDQLIKRRRLTALVTMEETYLSLGLLRFQPTLSCQLQVVLEELPP